MLLVEREQTRTEAMELAQKAAALDSKSATPWLVLGYGHQLNRKRAEARAAYQKCAEKNAPVVHVRECKSLVKF